MYEILTGTPPSRHVWAQYPTQTKPPRSFWIQWNSNTTPIQSKFAERVILYPSNFGLNCMKLLILQIFIVYLKTTFREYLEQRLPVIIDLLQVIICLVIHGLLYEPEMFFKKSTIPFWYYESLRMMICVAMYTNQVPITKNLLSIRIHLKIINNFVIMFIWIYVPQLFFYY